MRPGRGICGTGRHEEEVKARANGPRGRGAADHGGHGEREPHRAVAASAPGRAHGSCSPVWMRLCRSSWLGLAKAFSQVSHLNTRGFCELREGPAWWVCMCSCEGATE